jgi:hypothetical protein
MRTTGTPPDYRLFTYAHDLLSLVVDSLVYVNGAYGADLLNEALEREEGRLSKRQPLTKVSNSRLKFLKKRDGFKTPGMKCALSCSSL